MSVTGTLGAIAVFLILAFYVRFWTGQILLALHDSSYLYAITASAVCFGVLLLSSFLLQTPHIMTLTALFLLSPIVAAFIYGEDAL